MKISPSGYNKYNKSYVLWDFFGEYDAITTLLENYFAVSHLLFYILTQKQLSF